MRTHSNPVTQSLVAAHRNMERVLTLIRLKLDNLQPAGDEADYQLLGNAVGYMQNYPGVSHHPTEDVIIAKLLGRAPDSRALCTQLSDQHRRFGRAEVTMLHKLRNAQDGDAQACHEAKEIGTAYCTEHASHIHNEERELFPQAIRWLDDADWEAVLDHSRATLDPVFARKELKRFDNLHDYLMTVPAELGSAD